MADGCPARAVVEAFATGKLADRERPDVELHLGQCLSCAETLDRLTRAQLDLLVGDRCSMEARQRANGLALENVMRKAAGTDWAEPGPDLNRVVAAFDQAEREGSLGTFAGFDVLEVVGRGGMGVVLKARDRTLDRVVAMKVILPTGADEKSFTTLFLEEARAVAAIQHDHIVAVHHAGTDKGLPYLVMPFCAGGTLAGWLSREGKLAPKDAARVALQLARALAATHECGILHRDLKPSNVLLEDEIQRVRLADFSLAQPLASAGDKIGRRRRTVAGTPHYMSPEQARGEVIDARSDLFGLGAVLYQMVTGRAPYPGDSSEEVLSAAVRCELRPVRDAAPKVPSALAAIIDRLLKKRPEDRFATAREVATELERFVNAGQRRRVWIKRTAAAGLDACLIAGATIVALDWSGRTAIINSILSQRTGAAHYIRGRFGVYARLPDAITAARPHDAIEMRFSGERLMDPFRIGGKPLTIRAAPGFTPILVATNNGQPMILVDAPLDLEGLTLWRRGPQINFVPLISIEKAPLHLLNCRLIRSRFQGQNVLVWGRPRVVALNEPQNIPVYRAIIAFQHGSGGYFRNCVVAGTQATAIGLRASTNEPTRVEAENNVFATDATFAMKPDPETRVDLRFAHNVVLTGALLDLDETAPAMGISATWDDCIIDRSGGALLRVNQAQGGATVRALEWKETNVVYTGEGGFAVNRRKRGPESEAEWNDLMGLTTSSHRIIVPQVFPVTCVRSALQLNAMDLNASLMKSAIDDGMKFSSQFIGEGKPYETFRKERSYREWQDGVHSRAINWERRGFARPAVEGR